MALNASAIVETAYRLLTEYGLQDVSMRRLAAELDVRPGALYYHVPNKQELLLAVARHSLSALDVSGPADAAALMTGLRQNVLQLRDGADLMLLAYAMDPELPPVPLLRQALRSEGDEPEQAARRAGLLMRFALGALATEQNTALVNPDPGEGREIYEDGVRRLLGGCAPTQSSSS